MSNLAAFNASGNFTGWAPNANGTVKDFATDGTGAVIAGGSFTQINGSGRPHVAKILANGTLVAKTTFAAEADGDVQALAVSGNTLYMGGQFANVDGHARAFLGAVGAHERRLRLAVDTVRRRPRRRARGGRRQHRRRRVLPERGLRERRAPVHRRVRRHHGRAPERLHGPHAARRSSR